MTAEEFHQQQLEAQQMEEEIAFLKKNKRDQERNHGAMIGALTFYRDNKDTFSKELAIERLLELLDEYEDQKAQFDKIFRSGV